MGVFQQVNLARLIATTPFRQQVLKKQNKVRVTTYEFFNTKNGIFFHKIYQPLVFLVFVSKNPLSPDWNCSYDCTTHEIEKKNKNCMLQIVPPTHKKILIIRP